MTTFLSIVMVLVLVSFTSQDKEIKSVDVKSSTVFWVGKKVTGQHSGNITLKEGNLEFDGDNLVGGSFVMDMTSIVVTDIDGDGKRNLEGHLKDDDFFGVNEFPTASYTITSVASKGNGAYDISGDMVIKGISKPYTFELKMAEGKAMVNATIDRTDFDIKYKSASFFDSLGDKVIYDDFTLDITLVM